jgi:multicomponent Na+:H+ antiporter subunit F
MTEFYYTAALIVLANIAVSLLRVLKGPTGVDRMIGVQLIGTGGAALLVLLWLVDGSAGVLDVALLLTLLAAFAVVGFVKGGKADGAGDPELDE